jgi:hypothetical protein
LQQLGNTVLIVEHDEEIIRSADHVIDMGPMAGRHGGEVVFQGDHKDLLKEKKSLTARYMNGLDRIPIPEPAKMEQLLWKSRGLGRITWRGSMSEVSPACFYRGHRRKWFREVQPGQFHTLSCGEQKLHGSGEKPGNTTWN